MAANFVLGSDILNVLRKLCLRFVLACGLTRETTRLCTSGGWTLENYDHFEQPEYHLS